MRLLDDAIAVRGGEAEHRRRTGRWAANPEELAYGWKWEAEMAHTKTRFSRSSTAHLPGLVLKTTATAVAALEIWQQTASRRRAIADLTSDQLRDIGRSETPAPVLEVKAGLITNLKSMR